MRRSIARIFFFACLAMIASAAIVLAVDHILFRHGSWSGWQLSVTVAQPDDEQWWQTHVGPLPPRDPMANIVAVATVPGRDGSNMDGAPGLPGDRGHPPLFAYRMNMDSSMMRGGVLISPTIHAWRIGVDLPGGMAVERIYVGTPGIAPPHPTLGGWDQQILPIGLLLNSLIVAVPLSLVVAGLLRFSKWTVKTVRAMRRRRRGQCPACAYVLLPGQHRCPECGVDTSIPAKRLKHA